MLSSYAIMFIVVNFNGQVSMDYHSFRESSLKRGGAQHGKLLENYNQ